jgi:hypothetical protein
MYQVAMNRCLNKEPKLYGLSYSGVIGGGIIGILIWLKFGMTVGVISSSAGYGLAAYIARYMHNGSIQRLAYWYLPIFRFMNCKYLPPACCRCFI